MYHILTRFEYWSREGKKWTEWIQSFQTEDKKEAEKEIKRRKEKIKSIDKATKLKHEYKIEEIKKGID